LYSSPSSTKADVAAVGQDGRPELADVLGDPLAALGRGQEVVREVQVVVDLNGQVRQPCRAHAPGQPRLQLGPPRLGLGVELLGGVRGQMPAILADRGEAVAGRRREEQVVGPIEPPLEVGGDVLGVGRQAGPAEERLAERPPLRGREEVLLEPPEPLAVPDGEVARAQVVLQLQQHGALPGPPVGLAVGHDERAEPLGDGARGGVVGQLPPGVGVHLLEDADGAQARDGFIAGVREELQGAEPNRRELPQASEPADEPVEHIALLAGDPSLQPRDLGLEFVAGHGREEARPQLGIADALVQDDRAQGPQRGQGGLDRPALATQWPGWP
jgi:hypothetical protein